MNIIVPINVEVLRVSPSPDGSNPQSVKLALYDFSQAGINALAGSGSLIAANNFEHAQASINLQPGLHVHWSIPKVYTRGVQDNTTGNLGFPNLPNRWIVLRFLRNLAVGANNSSSVQIWILESDAHVAPDTSGFENSSNIPWMNDPQNLSDVSYRVAGQKINLSGTWNEPTGNSGNGVEYLGQLLQAPMAYGETFTAYYQNCGNIFGIYDTLADVYNVPNGLESNCHFSASYAVIGWVYPMANDTCIEILNNAVAAYQKIAPANQPKFEDYIQEVIEKQMQWSLDDYSVFTPNNAPQTQGVLSGISANVIWDISTPGMPTYPTATPDVSKVKLSIGNTGVEAISAYLNAVESGSNSADPGSVSNNTEWLLNALQYGQLPYLGAGELGVGQLDEYLQSKSFGSQPGGFIWTVRNIMTPNSGASPQPDVEVSLPLPLAKMLSLLNSSQYAYDSLSNELKGRQQKLFFDWCYHINAIENNVVNYDGSFDNDLSGPYLIEGLIQLFPRMLQAGAAGNIAGPTAPSTPYSYQPAAFSIQAPADLESNLASYSFNANPNTLAAASVEQLLVLYYNLAALVPNGITTLIQNFQTILLLLEAAQKGGNDASNYLQQALTLLQGAQNGANTLVAEFGKTIDPQNGIQAIQNAIQADIRALNQLQDPTSGIFAAIPITSNQQVPLAAGQVYTGSIAAPAYENAGAWASTGSGGFAGMKNLIDQCSGQNNYPFHLADIQAAGLYLASAYFWRRSGQIAVHTTAYYIQMAKVEIGNALKDANTASTALGNALNALNTSGGTLSNLQQGISNLADQVIPALLKDLNAGALNISGAISSIQQLLQASAADAQPLNLNVLATAFQSSDWLSFISNIEKAWITLLKRLPYAQQVSLLSTWLNNQIDSQYVLSTAPSDNFWQPKEPVLLLAEAGNNGKVIRPINRNGKAALLPCRLDTEVVSATTSYPSSISGLSTALNPKISGLNQVLQQLAEEAYLLCPEMETVVSLQVLQTAANQNEAAQINNFQRITLNPAPSGLNGKLPYYIAWNWSDGTDPFLPLFIFWSAEYVYSQQLNFATEQVPAGYLENQFTLDQYLVDNQLLASASGQFQKNAQESNFFQLFGVVTMSDSAAANLCTQIRSFCQQSLGFDPAQGPPDSKKPNYAEAQKLYQAYCDYKTLNVLAQGLSGFNSALLQRAQELQLPLNIPNSWTASSGKNFPMSDFWPTEMLFNQSQKWSATWASESINPNAFAAGDQAVYFNPLRAGFMQLQEVTLVDIFGRFVNITDVANKLNPPLVVSEALSSQTPDPLPDHPIYLPPRIVQPSRLLFKWLSAESPDVMQDFTEWNPHPASSPICAWMLPNHLDGSLMFYGADGKPLGSLYNINNGVQWFGVPGEAYVAGTAYRDLMVSDLQSKGANPVLQNFLETFVFPSNTTSYLNGLLQVMDQAQQFIITPGMQEDQALAVLIGQPLVLVEATLQLETIGLAYNSLDTKTYMPWDTPGPQFQLNGQGFIPYNFGNFNDGGLNNLQVPIRLGALEYQKNGQLTPYFDDGLVGFFINGDFSTMYTPVQLNQIVGPFKSTWQNTNKVALKPNGPPLTVTMLIDPRAAVHATTGILPVQDIQIPSDQYAQALGSLLVTFLTAPVLRSDAPINIPAPAETGYQWSWQQVGVTDEPLKSWQLNTDAVFPASPQYLVDGWLKLTENT